MVVKIVTDSGADLSEKIAKDLDITVVPLHIIFGQEEDFRDGVDMGHEELYGRIIKGSVIPTTSTASPGEFAEVFKKLIKDGASGIICINVSGKLSKTYGSASDAQELLKNENCPITVIDSENVAMGTGFLAVMAARLAKEGKSQAEIVDAVEESIPRVHMMAALDNLKYLIKGGRAPKIMGTVSDILQFKTFLAIKDGEIHPDGRTRTRREKISRLVRFVESFADSGVEEVAVEYGINKEEAEAVGKGIVEKFPELSADLSVLGAALGVHAGPDIIVVSVRTKK